MATKNVESLVLVGNANGIVIIPSNSPLKRLNYFDGKFLRASDLKDEQNYVRQLVRLSNQAGGSGAIHGFDLTLGGGDTLNLGPGLGIDPQGRVLLLPQEVSMGIQELIDLSLKAQATGKKKSKQESGVFGDCVMVSDTPPINQAFPGDLYLIVLFPAEALCGEEDVYGKLCEEACATSTDRPFAVEGLIVRAVPLVLQTPLLQSKIVTITSKLYLRSRVASAYFEDERLRVASMISKFGLAQEIWCLGAEAAGGNGLPIGVIARAGETTVFLDAWIARRERMDTPPRRYWQWRMMMRPWDVYIAQILQFQCQLRDLFDGDFTPEAEDPCGDAKSVLGEAAQKLADFFQAHKQLSTDSAFQADLLQLESMSQKLTLTEQGMKVLPLGNRWLIQRGILTTPSAGYLPVLPDANISVNEQVTRMMGEGVDLRFCIVRPDFVAHALEEAQHMERISLIEGLEDPKLKPEVDVLVPDGEFMTTQPATQPGFAVDAKLQAKHSFAGNSGTTTVPDVPFKGVARHETLSSSGTAFYLASSSPATATVLTMGLDQVKWRQLPTLPNPNTPPSMGVWFTFKSEKNFFLLKTGDKTNVNGEVLVGTTNQSQPDFRGEINGELTIGGPNEDFPITGTIDGKFSVSGIAFPAKSGTGKFSFLAKQEGSILQILFAHDDNKFQFGIDVDFSNPATVVAKLGSKILPNPSSMFEINFNSTLISNTDVFSATNADHVRAVQALGFIAGALKDPTFVAEKSKLLFPEVGTVQSTGIRATRDWVLFHRRRNKNCGAVAVSTRSYRVYQRAAGGVTNREDLFPKQPPTKEELLALTAKDLEGIKPIGVVTFGGGVATLVGDSSAVKNAWQKIPGGKIVWGAIASSGDAVNDGDALAASRLKNLESILDQVDPSARADVLPIVPPPLASNDVDGVIILVNASAPAPPPSANLRINKTAVLGQNAAGARTIVFNLEVVNDGPSAAQDVKVSDQTPANTTFLSSTAPVNWAKSGPASGGTGNVLFQKTSVAPGETANFQIVVLVSPNFPSGTINNVATVNSATSDPNQQNNTATTATTITSGTAPPPPPPPPKLTCLTVFSVSDFGELDLVRNEFNRGANPLSRLLPSLGDINFQERTTNVPDSSLVTTRTNYVKRNVGSVSEALLIMRKDVQAADADAFRKQVAALRAQFPIAQGAQPPLQELQLTTLPAEINCQAGVVLAGEVVG